MTSGDKSKSNYSPSYELDRRRFDTIFKDQPDTPILDDSYKLVYQGGHHDVYCNSSVHLSGFGGTCHNVIRKDFTVKRSFKCDCENYK